MISHSRSPAALRLRNRQHRYEQATLTHTPNPAGRRPAEHLPRLRFILTPVEGGRGSLVRLQRILRRMPDLRARARLSVVRTLSEADALLEKLDPDTIPVAAGGDGTVNFVAQAVLRTQGPVPLLGVLPLGTGNAFAHSVGVGRVSRALCALGGRAARLIDVMHTTHPPAPLALVSISTGIEGNFLHEYARWRRYSRLAAGAAALFRSNSGYTTGIAITLDGAAFITAGTRVYNAGLYNLPCYAAGHLMWPEADAADGEAEAVACLNRGAYWRVLRHGLNTASPRTEADLLSRRWRTAVVETTGPVQVDGEAIPCGSFEVWVERGALRVLTARPLDALPR